MKAVATVSKNDANNDLEAAWRGVAAAMAHFLIEEAGFGPLLFGDASEEPIAVRLDVSATDRAQLAEPIAQWLWAEVKQHRLGIAQGRRGGQLS
jgi:hypothetical protein